MSKFLTFYRIDSLSPDNEYRGLSPDSEAGTIINTLDQNIVLRIKLNNQKQIQSWTSSNQKLSHKVVYDFKSQTYVGIFNDRHLRCWTQNDEQIPTHKTKLPMPTTEIISFDDKHTILLYRDGTCESLQNCLEKDLTKNKTAPRTPIVDYQTQKIINIACFNTFDKHVMMTYFVRNTGNGAMEFVYFLLDDDTLTPTDNIQKVKIARNKSTLAAFTVVEGEKSHSVMTIWSDKRIFMLPIRFDEPPPTDVGSYLNKFHCLRVDKPLTIASVSKNCVVIYGGNPSLDGASLVLYNTRFHFSPSHQHFKVHLDNCRLWVIGTYILMAVGQQLTCARFRLSQEKLSDIIGSKRSIDFSAMPNKECINEDVEFEEDVIFGKGALQKALPSERMNVDEKVEKEVKTKMEPTETFQQFNNALSSLYRYDVAVEIITDDSMVDLRKANTLVHTQDRLYANEFIRSFAAMLENCGASEAEITEQLIPLLIKANFPKDLVICLRKYTNISERMLAKSLKYFVKMNESNEKLAFINQVFACSFHQDFIMQHLRTNLNLDDAMYLLELIYRKLDDDDEETLAESIQYGDEFDSDTALIDWFIVILDSHYQQFLLARDPTINEMVSKWKELIESFICNIRELNSMTARIQNLVDGKANGNGNTGSKCYSVEKVKLY